DQIRTWMHETQTGDRAELTDIPEDSPWWADLNANADSCLGQKCPLFSDCFVTRLRRKAQSADVLVVNHALLCADQRNEDGFGQIIPDAEVWILDEAHALEDVATNSFGIEVTGRQVRYLARDLQAAIPHIPNHNHTQYNQALEILLPAFLRICEHFGQAESHETLKTLKPELMFLEVALTSAKQDLLARRVDKLTTNLHFMLSEQAKDSGYVIFADRDNRGMTLRAAPIEPAQILEKTLWETENPVVLTSATLAIQNSLESFQKRLGLENCDGLILESPFDTKTQSALYIPQNFSSLDKEIKTLVSASQGGAFLLFTSYRAMNETYEKLMPEFESQGLQVFKQGDKPKLELIQDFIKADNEFGGVLFATHSFWEGVDVQGQALRLVVIDKLPFKSPKDPIHKARSQNLESKGISSFYGLSVPHAALTLKQGAGRLLRTHSDKGVVAILDPRLIQKAYGRVFLDTLPNMTRVQSIHEVEAFLN
ncbi:MAG: ATP-dependent DNA helicase, partial [Deltaproteobacteria bacterium]|nr:ATP-dependent DNA helicase [Deltaproteobacteria bacterium]